jgi:hypothetical protein
MRIEVIADDSISHQARTYAEYRLFAALSQAVGASLVTSALLSLRRATSRRSGAGVLCSVTVELSGGGVRHVRAAGDHPYAAINRAVERVRMNAWPAVRHERREPVAAE